jgi:hypothetical protein
MVCFNDFLPSIFPLLFVKHHLNPNLLHYCFEFHEDGQKFDSLVSMRLNANPYGIYGQYGLPQALYGMIK